MAAEFGKALYCAYRFVIENKAQEVKMGKYTEKAGEGSRVYVSFVCTHLSQHFYAFTELETHYAGLFWGV